MTLPTTFLQKPGFLINRNFALLWGGQTISSLGDFVFDTTLVLWIAAILVRGQSWAPLAVSGVLLATSVPILVFRPFLGVFVDRWDKRKTMLLMDGLRTLLIALLLLAADMVPLPFFPDNRLPLAWKLGAIYSIVFLATICSQFFNPSHLTMLGDIVEESSRGRASGLTTLTTNLAVLIGPPLAAALLFSVGVQWALLINALSFAVSFLSILAIRVPHQTGETPHGQQHHFRAEFAEGIRFFVGNRPLKALVFSLALAMLGYSAQSALNVFFLIQNLRSSADLYGFIGTSWALGSIVGAIFAARFTHKIGAARMFWAALLISGTLALVYARLTTFAAALVVNILTGFFDAGTNVAWGPLVLHLVPRAYIGRIGSIGQPIVSFASLISVSLSGYLASNVLHDFHATFFGLKFGPIDTIFLGGGLLVLMGGLYGVVGLRGVRLEGEGTSEEQQSDVPATST